MLDLFSLVQALDRCNLLTRHLSPAASRIVRDLSREGRSSFERWFRPFDTSDALLKRISLLDSKEYDENEIRCMWNVRVELFDVCVWIASLGSAERDQVLSALTVSASENGTIDLDPVDNGPEDVSMEPGEEQWMYRLDDMYYTLDWDELIVSSPLEDASRSLPVPAGYVRRYAPSPMLESLLLERERLDEEEEGEMERVVWLHPFARTNRSSEDRKLASPVAEPKASMRVQPGDSKEFGGEIDMMIDEPIVIPAPSGEEGVRANQEASTATEDVSQSDRRVRPGIDDQEVASTENAQVPQVLIRGMIPLDVSNVPSESEPVSGISTPTLQDGSLRELRSLFLDVKTKPRRKRWISLPFHMQRFYIAVDELLDKVRVFPDSFPFRHRVSKQDAPGYYDIIKKPIDLSMISRKLNRCEYRSKWEVVNDFETMFANCRTYNTDPNSVFLAYCSKTESLVLPLLAAIPDVSIDDDAMEASYEAEKIRELLSISVPDASTPVPAPDAQNEVEMEEKETRPNRRSRLQARMGVEVQPLVDPLLQRCPSTSVQVPSDPQLWTWLWFSQPGRLRLVREREKRLDGSCRNLERQMMMRVVQDDDATGEERFFVSCRSEVSTFTHFLKSGGVVRPEEEDDLANRDNAFFPEMFPLCSALPSVPSLVSLRSYPFDATWGGPNVSMTDEDQFEGRKTMLSLNLKHLERVRHIRRILLAPKSGDPPSGHDEIFRYIHSPLPPLRLHQTYYAAKQPRPSASLTTLRGGGQQQQAQQNPQQPSGGTTSSSSIAAPSSGPGASAMVTDGAGAGAGTEPGAQEAKPSVSSSSTAASSCSAMDQQGRGRGCESVGRLSEKVVHTLLRRVVCSLLSHAGFEATASQIVDIFVDIVAAYLTRVGQLIRVYEDRNMRGGQRCSFSQEAYEALRYVGMARVSMLAAYLDERVVRFGQNLVTLEKVLLDRYQEAIKAPIVEAKQDSLVAEADEWAFSSGYFGESMSLDLNGQRIPGCAISLPRTSLRPKVPIQQKVRQEKNDLQMAERVARQRRDRESRELRKQQKKKSERLGESVVEKGKSGKGKDRKRRDDETSAREHDRKKKKTKDD